MSLVQRALSLLTAVLAIVVAGWVAAPAASASPIYHTAGYHVSDGRNWRTYCEEYSSEIDRCRTEIQIDKQWVFNNLTYVGAGRAAWKGNPLGETGTWQSSGLTWRTECGTENTGTNACRTYIKRGGDWVFNNTVNFQSTNLKVNTTWRPTTSQDAPAPAAAAQRTAPEAQQPDPLPSQTGRTWTINLRSSAIHDQSTLDRCSTNPGLWNADPYVAAHNYCNNWEADAWHGMRPGDRVTVTSGGKVILDGIVERDFSFPYGPWPKNEEWPTAKSDFFVVQASWRDEIAYDTNHVIVVRKL